MSQLCSTKLCLCLLFLTHGSPQESDHLKSFSKDKHPSKSHHQASGKAASYQRTCFGINSFEGRHRVPQPLMGRQRQQVWSPHDRPQAAGCGPGTSSIRPQAERQPRASRSQPGRRGHLVPGWPTSKQLFLFLKKKKKAMILSNPKS